MEFVHAALSVGERGLTRVLLDGLELGWLLVLEVGWEGPVVLVLLEESEAAQGLGSTLSKPIQLLKDRPKEGAICSWGMAVSSRMFLAWAIELFAWAMEVGMAAWRWSDAIL